MGLSLGMSRSSYDKNEGYAIGAGSMLSMCVRSSLPAPMRKTAPNPDPNNYVIKDSQMVRGHAILMVHYPDATSYEGHKILFYKNTKLDDIRKQKHLDPHFSNNKQFLSPFARFEPTNDGWDAAVTLAMAIG